MVFSLRTAMISIAVAGLWLAALLSDSRIFLGVVAYLSTLVIVLTLPLAILDSRPSQRPFWIGFFIVAMSNLALSSLPVGNMSRPFSLVNGQIADLVQRDIPPSYENQSYVPAPPGMYTGDNPPLVSVADIAQHEQRVALLGTIPACLSLVLGCIGGSICKWCARP